MRYFLVSVISGRGYEIAATDQRPFVLGLMDGDRGERSCEVVFGSFTQTVVGHGIHPRLQILGFIPSDKSLPFASVSPLALPNTDGYLPSVALSMVENDLDAVLFGDRDYILRACTLPRDPGAPAAQDRHVLLLGVPSKPLFNVQKPTFSYQPFSLSALNSLKSPGSVR
jgi:hypothetical protein